METWALNELLTHTNVLTVVLAILWWLERRERTEERRIFMEKLQRLTTEFETLSSWIRNR